MTAELWLSVRGQRQLPTTIWFDFYREMGGKVDNIDVFHNILSYMFDTEPVVFCSDGGQKKITALSALNSIHRYYDQKFGIWTSEAKDS